MPVQRHEVPDPAVSLRLFTLFCGCLAILGLALPSAAAYADHYRHNSNLLVAVHAFVLGVTALEMGGFYQLVPVMLQAEPAERSKAANQMWLYGAGTLVMLIGFRWWLPTLLAVGGTLVLTSAIWFASLVVPGIIRARAGQMLPAFLGGAVTCLVLAMTMGVTMALNLQLNFLPHTGTYNLAAHLALGVGGWFGLAIVGLSYRLGAMFYLTRRGEAPAAAVYLAWATVVALCGAVTALLFQQVLIARPLLA